MPFSIPLLLPSLRTAAGALVDDAAWTRIESLAEDLPPIVAQGAFETRLAAGERRVDFGFYIDGCEGRRVIQKVIEQRRNLPAGDKAQPLLVEWSQPGTKLAEQSACVWIEYDLPDDQPLPAPMVHFGLTATPCPLDVRDLAQEVRRLVTGCPPCEEQLTGVELYVRELPRDGQIRYFADQQPARPTQDMRLLAMLPDDQVALWLQAIGWPGDWCRASFLLEFLGSDGHTLPIVYLDIGDALRPSLAIEIPLPDPCAASGPLTSALQRIVDAGAAAPERAEAVLAWIGGATIAVPGIARLLRIERHPTIKLALDVRGELSAKAYLFFTVRETLF